MNDYIVSQNDSAKQSTIDVSQQVASPYLDHFIFIRLDERRSQIAALEEQVKSIKQQITDVKETARQEALASMVNARSEEIATTLAAHFYWLHEDLISAQTIGEYFGIAAQGVAMRVRRMPLTLRCIDCGEYVEHYPTSRTDAKYHESSGTCVCADCEQNRKYGYSKQAEEFRERVMQLRRMPYADYLRTDHWQELRKRMLKRANYKCQVCNSGGQLHVHHRTYVNRGNEDLKDLIVLCATCHQEFHDKMELAK